MSTNTTINNDILLLDLLNDLVDAFDKCVTEDKKIECKNEKNECIRRIIKALVYYEQNGRDKFIDFCDKKYASQIVEDYINFMDTESNFDDSNMECKSAENNECPFVRRHFRNKNDYNPDECSHLYTELFDSIHFNIRHRNEEKCNFDYYRMSKLKEDRSKFNLIVTTIQQQKENEENEMLGNKVFYYWDYYKQSKPEYYVSAQYESIKDEALFSGFVSVEDWDALIVEKAQRFIKSNKCKQMHCIEKYDELHYNIPHKAPLTVQHLQSIILWCDFIDFSWNFRSSFRSITWNESLSSIKERNAKYHHVAKYLNETVTYFGINRDTQSGPFYCGMNMEIQIPSFSAKLNGPISTSKSLGVIQRLCGTKGMILEFDNRSLPGIFETFFDCKWLSFFPEEDEYLYVCGRYKMKIASIRMMDKKSKQWVVHTNKAYLSFNQLISGKWSDQTVNDLDVSMLRDSVAYALKRLDKNKVGNNQYLYTNFRLFCQLKEKIILNLYDMDKCVEDKAFVALLMHSVVQINANKLTQNDQRNVCKSELFSLFPNMKEIIIYSSSLFYVYAFDILCLLDMISAHSNSCKRVIIKDVAKDEYKWLYLSVLDVKNDDKSKRYIFEMKREENEDSLIVSL